MPGPRCSRKCRMPPGPPPRWKLSNGPAVAQRMPMDSVTISSSSGALTTPWVTDLDEAGGADDPRGTQPHALAERRRLQRMGHEPAHLLVQDDGLLAHR